MRAGVVIGHIEDDDVDAAMFRRAFSRTSDVRRWCSSAAFLADLASEPGLLDALAAFVVDLRLPDGDGVAIAELLRASPGGAELPIVVLTGSAKEADVRRALDAGATEVEIKPTSVRGLFNLVDRTSKLLRTARR